VGNGGNVSKFRKDLKSLKNWIPDRRIRVKKGKISEPSRLSTSNSIICQSQKHPED